MNALHIKNTVLAVLAAAGSAIAQALGGWDMALKVLICFMVLDYATGWMVAAIWHKSSKSGTGALSSDAGFKGLAKKCVMLALSRPARGAWIEIFPPAVRDPDGPRRTPRGVRGLK